MTTRQPNATPPPTAAAQTGRNPYLRRGAAPLVIAHRGASAVAPENTMPAFEAAWAAGAEWVETDVQPCSDNRLVLIHDATVDRTTDGTGEVRTLTAAELAGLDAGTHFDTGFAGSRIPTLADLLTRLTPPRRLLLEIKGDHSQARLRDIVAAIRDSPLGGRYLLQSFERDVLTLLRAMLPAEPLGLLVEVIEGDPVQAARRFEAVTYNPDVDELMAHPELVAELHAAGIASMPWIVNDPAQWATLTDLGIDGIITDRPGKLLAWQRAHHPAAP
jgi:glycerophosphoryl diester phosphodiesterase